MCEKLQLTLIIWFVYVKYSKYFNKILMLLKNCSWEILKLNLSVPFFKFINVVMLPNL